MLFSDPLEDPLQNSFVPKLCIIVEKTLMNAAAIFTKETTFLRKVIASLVYDICQCGLLLKGGEAVI